MLINFSYEFLTPAIFFIHKIFIIIKTKIMLYFEINDNADEKDYNTFKYTKFYLDISGDFFLF